MNMFQEILKGRRMFLTDTPQDAINLIGPPPVTRLEIPSNGSEFGKALSLLRSFLDSSGGY